MKLQIKSVSGSVLFEAEAYSIKELLVVAVRSKADLYNADLSEANLSNANLSRATLSNANLSNANLSRATLSNANLSNANLSGAYLSRAYLSNATLYRTDLSNANLSNANLSGAYLSNANLSNANLSNANLSKAYLTGADLSKANLYIADLSNAHFSRANLSGAYLSRAKNLSILTAAQTSVVPETGTFQGWKKCCDDVLVRVMVGRSARRSNATGRKCRAEYVKVLEVVGADVGISTHDKSVKYELGKIVRCKHWEEDRWRECADGIHFFLTRAEAEAY